MSKVFYLHFTQDDFDASWQTEVIDLYQNNQYTNWATRKATQGTNLTGNGIYTGLNVISPGTTEVGYLSSGRFIDTSAQIDLMTWEMPNFTYTNSGVSTQVSINVYTSPDATPGPAPSPPYSDWTQRTARVGQDLLVMNCNRYVFFELDITSDATLTGLEFDIYIRVEIDSAVVNGYFSKTLKLLNMFPSWMEMRELDNTASEFATPPDATPSSLGGKFLNAVAGEWLTDVAAKIQHEQYQHFIEQVDSTQKAWSWEVDNVPSHLVSVVGDGNELARCASLSEFYETTDTDDIFWWDETKNKIQLTHKYTTLVINGETYSTDASPVEWAELQAPNHIWNAFDDLGASVDLYRLIPEQEDNDTFRKRIMDVYRNRPGVGMEAFKLALRRELNLWYHMDSATPDSDWLGATPEVLEIEDIEQDSKYFSADGMPTDEFKALVNYLAAEYPILWGYFQYDRAFWDPDGLERKGIHTLPRLFDATPMPELFRQSGVGDMNDLYLFKPAEYTVPQEFTADLVVRGRQKSVQEAYPGLRFEVSLWGQADVSQYDNPEFSGNYTLLITDANADVWFANFTLSATTDTDINATPTSGSYAELNFATADGFTSLFLQFANTATGDLYTDDSATPASPQIDLSGITDLEILAGHWDVDLQTVINVPSQILYRLWFKHDPGTILGFGGNPSSISTSSYDWLTQGGDIVLESLVENFEEATPNDAATPALANWQSDIFHYTINIDGALPGLTKQSMSITVPHELINWPDDAIYRELYLQLETSNDGVTYGANSTEWAATPTFVDDTHISVNGDATWTDNRYKILDPDTTTITFSSEDGPDYPIDSAVWTLFEETYVGAVQGTVDANGPWRDDEPGLYGANNEILLYADVSRADFAIPETEDYILTWIGVANNDNPNVIVWLDSNTIKPAVAPPEEFQWAQKTYSAKAIEEYYDDEGATPYNGYRLSPFPVKAKLKLTVNERWHPNIHSGWFYDDTEEYYLYADKKIETATTDSHSLSGVNYQGAPIIVSGTPGHYLRQIHFWEMDYNATPATPNYTFTNTQEVYGTGTDVLYAAYHDIYDIDVYDMTLDQAVSITSTASSTNEIQTVDPTNKYHTYRLRYKVSQSYIVEVLSPDEAVVHFDQQPSNYGYASYTITYEGSRYDPATPISIPLNTLHTAFDEGFVFIDHDAHDLQRIEVRISPSKVVAEDEDFLVIVIETYDIFGNPKPNIEVNLYTNYGLLSDSSVITDQDGRAHTVLTAYEWGADTPNPSTPALSDATPNDYPQGLILAEDTSTSKSTIAAFDIHRKQPKKSTLIAVMESDNILADGESTTYILGRVLDPNRNPISNVKIDWKKARTIYELFGSFAPHASPPYDNNGVTWTDSMGRFRIGPLVSDVEAGYWLAAIEGTDLYNAQVDFDNNNMSILASVTDISLDIQSVNAIVKQGKYVYATDAFDGQLLIFDVSDPNTPELVGYLNESELNSAADIIVEGDYCYIQGFGMSGVALVIVDVSDPTNPTTAAVTDIRCNSLVKDGRYCYVVSSSTDRLTVVDVANPTNPAEVGFVSDATALDNASGVCKDGDYCYVACSGGTGKLTVVDVSDPANPSIVGYLSDTSIAGAISVVKDGDLCYLASQTTDRLSIIDVSDPVNPTIVSYTDPSSLDGANKVVKHGDYCYVASSAADAVSVIDVSNPASPTIVGYITDSVLNGVSGLAFDNYICYAGGVSGGVGNGHLNVIQIPTTEPKIGDVVYWFEHPNINLSVDVVSGLPPLPIQQSTPTWFLPPYVYGSQFPVTVDEEDFYAGESATPSIQWNPPVWYAIDKYRQYHMGLSAIEGYYTGDVGGDGSDDPATPGYPDYVEY